MSGLLTQKREWSLLLFRPGLAAIPPSGWELLPGQPSWLQVARTPPQCLFYGRGGGDSTLCHCKNPLPDCFIYSVHIFCSFCPRPCTASLMSPHWTLGTAELGESCAFPLRAPGRRGRPVCWEAWEEVCCNGVVYNGSRQTCCVSGRVRGGDKYNIVSLLLAVLCVHSGHRTPKSIFLWVKIVQ